MKNDREKVRPTLLRCLQEFSITQERPFDRGFIGELLVYDKLLSFPFLNEVTYEGSSRKKYDIYANQGDRTIYLQVKSTRDERKQPVWVRQHAKTFCTFSPEGAIETVKKMDENLYFVFINLTPWHKRKDAEYFLIPSNVIAKTVYNHYSSDHGKTERKSDDTHITYDMIKKYRVVKMNDWKKRLAS